ncbi:Type 1 glutamine amidotransferase-like domain-containing protein [Fusibacter ferrireducens]|uniref:Type 1 glutamine amidotransferase-like domain-containing protein n=1 Tax=Fusibacter ferrireducens TaxID=2785058 RepID=A0ABR9ZTJ4_9FIRM|nr:Type 1 glutamine amidotransferase-like domain-containing protein [Fusibacter ferrireducens]MBF4693767.1 Type 1 glutamine amidotransferase-like domain-containing protein [Fusibacter ferrireducens]
MRRLILTSTGFDNKNIERIFKEMISKEIQEIKVLFIPRAALESNNQDYIELCRAELINLGILESNIRREDLNNEIPKDEISLYDVIYVTGGKTNYLIEYMEKYNFRESLDLFFENNGIYIGVSAGSIALSTHRSKSLGYLKSRIEVHSEVGTDCGEFIDDVNHSIKLTDKQAIIIIDDAYKIIE